MSKRRITEMTAVGTQWDDVLLVCRKCSKKIKGGFGPDGRDALSGTLKKELRRAGLRSAVLVRDTKCLGLCPKNAVTVLAGRTPEMMLAVPAGADPAAIVSRLRPPA